MATFDTYRARVRARARCQSLIPCEFVPTGTIANGTRKRKRSRYGLI